MKKRRGTGIFILLMLLSFWVLLFSFWDIMFDKGWILPVIGAYAFLLFLSIIFLILTSRSPATKVTIEEFEKTLKGKLHHFKCPNCEGIFAIKKSKHNNKKPFKMNCPDCGKVATVSPTPRRIEGEIPEKKSVNVNFKCDSCGEGVTVWAEGAELYSDVDVHSCPYCGLEKSMNRI